MQKTVSQTVSEEMNENWNKLKEGLDIIYKQPEGNVSTKEYMELYS